MPGSFRRAIASTILVCGLTVALNGGAQAQTPDSAGRLETEAIERVIREYREAVEALDAKRVKRIWPSANEKALTRAFQEMDRQSLSFDACVIGVDDGRATATCSGNARIVPRVGSQVAQYLVGEWRFTLRRNANVWIIQSLEARGH